MGSTPPTATRADDATADVGGVDDQVGGGGGGAAVHPLGRHHAATRTANGEIEPSERQGGLPGEAAPCRDFSAAFCRAFVKMGQCSKVLSVALSKCPLSCGICVPSAAAQPGSDRGLPPPGEAEDDDVSGYGHHATHAELARRRALEEGDRELLYLFGGAALVAIACCCAKQRSRRMPWQKPQKLQDKCAV